MVHIGSGLNLGSELNLTITTPVAQVLEGYMDADGSSQKHQRVISGYTYLVDGGAVLWMSYKQELVILSMTEAKYIAATHAAKEGAWLCRLISEVFCPLTEPTTLYCNNQSAIVLTKDSHFHACMKHLDIHYHYIRYIIDDGSFMLIYCSTEDITADIFMKPLPAPQLLLLVKALDLRISTV